MAEKPIDPKWTRWHNSVSQCTSCGAEPQDRVKNRYWRKQVSDHGHGFPPAKYIKPLAVLSKAQGAVKETPKEKDPNTLFDDADVGIEDLAPTTKPKKRPETGPAGHIDWNHINIFGAPKVQDEEEEKPL